MKQKYRWLFDALTLIASASILFGCKPNVPPSSEAAKITVTVQGDEQVTVQEPKTFQVDKGAVWKTVKEQVKVTYKDGYKLSNWKVGNKDGKALTDEYVFTENTTVFAVSKLIEASNPVTFTTVQYAQLKNYLENAANKPAADGVYYIEVTGLTNTDLESSSWDTPSPFGQILKDCGKKVALKLKGDMTVIGMCAFSGCMELTSIIIPEGITKIDSSAFSDCTGLTEVKLPATLDEIKDNSFSRCENLTVIAIAPTNPTYGCKDSIVYDNEKKALFAAPGITGSITIPDDITAIGGNAFSGCTKLENVTIPKSVTEIGWQAFQGCTKLTEVKLPATLNEIQGSSFSHCINHTKLTVEAGNSKYKSENNMVYTSDMKTLVCAAGGLTSITIPNSVTTIGERACSGCTGLTSVTIPEGVTAIGYGAFFNCTGLTSVSILEGVTTIGPETFSKCTGLTSITIPEGVTVIDGGAFSGCAELTSVTIPRSLTSIAALTFNDCSALTQVEFPEYAALTTIEKSAFEGCISLTTITIPNNVTTIGDSTFVNCRALKTVHIGNKVEHIGWAFSGCINAEITLPESIITIDDAAFGRDTPSYCKKVRIKSGTHSGEIKSKVIATGYPEDRIEEY